MRLRTVDIAMSGARTPTRERFLAGAANQLWEWCTDIRLADPRSGAPWVLSAVDLARTRILIDVAGPDDTGAGSDAALLLEAIRNGCVVVTNRPDGLAPYVPGEHFLVSPLEYLAEQAVALALDEDRRSRIAVAAAVVRPDQPLPVSAARRHVRASLRPRVGRVARAVVRAVLPAAPGDEVEVRRLRELQTGVKRAYVDQVEATRAIDRALAMARNAAADRDADPDVVVTASTPAYDSAEPIVTVVVPAHAERTAMRSVLMSICAAGRRTPEPVEVIVVDRGADGSPATTHALLDELSWLPMLAVRPVAGGGTADALNTGLRRARAPHVLPLEPGEELFPNAIAVLLARLVAAPPDVVATYGIVARFDDHGPAAVSGALGWDIPLLLRERTCDTVALFRRDALTDLGGFATTAALEGWARHDLWLAAAARGWRADPAAAIVGRSARPTARPVDLIDPTTTWLSLYERHPRLPWPS